jgi:hypothetical protein
VACSKRIVDACSDTSHAPPGRSRTGIPSLSPPEGRLRSRVAAGEREPEDPHGPLVR